ncbi:protein translocase subunit, variant 2 [Entomophthora muscae]|uniref:Protein translocase subunit, variant 2 n=1 Tax=Entomophthora muscae TaxID=34485 RepID=A0ACC2T8K1_9FUNG|nr:protein translocase subunit, variant 2 [Entomophthora muscae]
MYRQLSLYASRTGRLTSSLINCTKSSSITIPKQPSGLQLASTQYHAKTISRQFSGTCNALVNNKSFVGAFVESVRRQVRENKDFKENIKQLQDTSKQLGDSEALRRAKEMFAKAKTDASDSAVTKSVNEAMIEVKRYADSVGKTVDEVLHEINENEFVKATRQKMQKVGESIHKSTEPIRNHPAYKTVKSEVESYAEDASRYGGFRDKESRLQARKKILARMEAEGVRARIVKEDPTAGQNVVLHKDSAWKESWTKFKDNSSVMQGLFKLKKSYNESENTFVSNIRDITDTISEKFALAFSESEQAKAIKIFQMTVDPTFSIERFLKEARDYIIPEFLDAFVHADQLALKQWCSEGVSPFLFKIKSSSPSVFSKRHLIPKFNRDWSAIVES